MAAVVEQLIAKAGDTAGLLEILLPGISTAIVEHRKRVKDFCEDHLAHTLLLRGSVGAGKSSLARVIALLRYTSLLTVEAQRGFLEPVRFDGSLRIDKRYLQWYEEFAITGQNRDLVETQLFGSIKGAYTDAESKLGIFEAAARGHSVKGSVSNEGAKVTGGVVFLDEVGELAKDLQPKLLLVLTGAEVFRLGGEGNSEFGFRFDGVTIAATWQEPSKV